MAATLNVAVVDNDRGARPNSYRAFVLGACAQEVPSQLPLGYMQGGTAIARNMLLSDRGLARQRGMTLCWGRWLGLTPEQPALCLRGLPGWPRAKLR